MGDRVAEPLGGIQRLEQGLADVGVGDQRCGDDVRSLGGAGLGANQLAQLVATLIEAQQTDRLPILSRA